MSARVVLKNWVRGIRQHGLGPFRRSQYWQERKDLNYYKCVRQWMEEAGRGDLLLDIGSGSTPLAGWGEFAHRIALDIRPHKARLPGVEYVYSDWMTWEPPATPDLIVCCQVLEHLPDDIVMPFARRLLNAKRSIISVPYHWPVGFCEYHRQDPVTLEKFVGWMGREPFRVHVAVDHADVCRLVAEYR